jgi:hypothetical protein
VFNSGTRISTQRIRSNWNNRVYAADKDLDRVKPEELVGRNFIGIMPAWPGLLKVQFYNPLLLRKCRDDRRNV